VASRLAVTGANGFVGRSLVRYASALGHEVVGVVRSDSAAKEVLADGGRPSLVPSLSPEPLAGAFAGCAAVVHLAQIGHERPGATYQAVNASGTEAVAAAARAAKVGRVVYFSGLGVARIGQKQRCTNRYFLSKLQAEVALFRSELEVVIFRPSYIVGPGESFLPNRLRELAGDGVERPGDGSYRMQPIAVRDAVALVMAALERPAFPLMYAGGPAPLVYDLVGPEAVTYQQLLERLVQIARALGRPVELKVREVGVADADARARSGGWRGMTPDELDCLLCDEVSDPGPLEGLLGRFLTPLDEALSAVVRAS
jgi:nucleoside-diphosphate-sugar epimerase